LSTVVACNKTEDVESTDIRTSGIYPEFTVLATGNGKSQVSVKLKTGGNDSNTYLDLTGPDELVCTAADTEKTLTQDGTAYKATFSTDEGGTVFTFSLNRGDEDENAPDSHVTLPDPYVVDGVDSTTEISRADGTLEVTWDASDADDTHTWTVTGEDCLFQTDGNASTDGKLTLRGDDFNATPSAEDPEATEAESTCEATLCIDRKLTGSLDPAFAEEEGGEIRAIQRRCVTFISTP
jgi:hypothetical protein